MPAVIQSARASAALTLVTSPIAFSPAPGAQAGPVTPSAHLVTNGQLPSAITTASGGNPVLICMSTTQPVPPQPVPCSSFGGLGGPDWTCITATAGTASVTWGALVAMNTGFNAFACKDGLTYSTSSGNAYTFGPYSHTIAMTGAVADFNAGAEGITTSDANTAYVSYDATNLYVGFNSPNVNVVTSPGEYIHFYIGGSAGGTSTADTVLGLGLGGALPPGFRGLFHVYWKNDNTATHVDQYNGSNWVASAIVPTIAYNGGASTFVEFRIPLAAIGSPTDIHLLGGASVGGGAASSIDVWPNGNADGLDFIQWQTEFLDHRSCRTRP